MLHRGIKFAHAAILLFSALLSFMVVRSIDEDSILGPSAFVDVGASESDSTGAVPSSRVVDALSSIARSQRVNIGRLVPDVEDPDGGRNLYLAVGDPDASSASWVDGGYPDFSHAIRTEVHPLDEISHMNTTGHYMVFGPKHVAEKVQDQFTELGFQAQSYPAPQLSDYVTILADGALLWCFVIVLIAAVMVIGSGVVLNAKSYGVLRLQGYSFIRIFGRDIAQLAKFWICAFIVVVAACLLFLAMYNGLHRLVLFGLMATGMLVVFALAALTAHVLALALTFSTAIVHAIKGEVSATLAMTGVYCIRISAVLLTFVVAVSTVTAAQEVRKQQDSWQSYSTVGDATYVQLGGTVSGDFTDMDATVGPWIRRIEEEGRVILSARSELRQFVPSGSGWPDRDVLIVNDTFLSKRNVRSPTGHRYSGIQGDSEVQIMFPERLDGDLRSLSASIAERLKVQQSDVEELPVKSGQSVFTYGSGTTAEMHRDALVQDPVVVAVSSDVLSNSWYTTYAVQNGVVFTDPADVRSAISDKELGAYVWSMRPVAQHAADKRQELVGKFRFELFNLVTALTVLLVTSVSVSLVYRQRNMQALFVRHLSGWTFVRAYWSLLALEGAFVLGTVGWSAWDVWSRIIMIRSRESSGAPAPPGDPLPLDGWSPAVMTSVSLLSLGFALVFLIASHGRFIRQRCADM